MTTVSSTVKDERHRGPMFPLEHYAELTPRENHILARRQQGLGPKETAVELGLSVSTVKQHLQNIRSKLGSLPPLPRRMYSETGIKGGE